MPLCHFRLICQTCAWWAGSEYKDTHHRRCSLSHRVSGKPSSTTRNPAGSPTPLLGHVNRRQSHDILLVPFGTGRVTWLAPALWAKRVEDPLDIASLMLQAAPRRPLSVNKIHRKFGDLHGDTSTFLSIPTGYKRIHCSEQRQQWLISHLIKVRCSLITLSSHADGRVLECCDERSNHHRSRTLYLFRVPTA